MLAYYLVTPAPMPLTAVVPCRLTNIDLTNGTCDVTFTATRGPWRRGETYRQELRQCCPRRCLRRSRQHIGRYYVTMHDWTREICGAEFVPEVTLVNAQAA